MMADHCDSPCSNLTLNMAKSDFRRDRRLASDLLHVENRRAQESPKSRKLMQTPVISEPCIPQCRLQYFFVGQQTVLDGIGEERRD